MKVETYHGEMEIWKRVGDHEMGGGGIKKRGTQVDRRDNEGYTGGQA